MKTLHLSIITIATIFVIAATSFGVFIEKIGENQPQSYASIIINGIKENYTVGEPISFSVMLEGHGTGCGDTMATITKENDTSFQPIGWGSEPSCTSNVNPSDFKFTALSEHTIINRTGTYILKVTFDNLVTNSHTETEKRFLVIPYLLTGMATVPKENNSGVTATHNTSIFDTGVYPFFVNVDNDNFTLNYNITGNGKILDANMDSQSKSLILSLNTTNDGTLIVSIPRALLDIKKNDRGMGEFYMLADGQETDFKEIHTTLTDRVFSIPFQNGTKSIEIIATELI